MNATNAVATAFKPNLFMLLVPDEGWAAVSVENLQPVAPRGQR